MAINVSNNQSQLQMLANGACPAPAQPAQVVLVTNQNDDCNTPACPAPTPAPTFLNPDGLFSANQCELTYCLENTGVTTVPIIYGVSARKGEYVIDGRLPASVVDNALVESCDDYLASSQGEPINAPSIQYANEFSARAGIVIGKVVIEFNGATDAASLASQAKQNMEVLQFPLDLAAECKVSRVRPVCLLSCGSGEFIAGNVSAQFNGPFVANTSNGFRYPLLGGSTISMRVCVTGRYTLETVVPC